MAVYKVPQDVEADDKLIGFLSFKQFIFVVIAIMFYVVTYMLYTISFVFAIIPLPFALFFTILGLWPRKDQPVDVYLMALVKFYFKPRKRVWSPEGHVERVRITAPKVEKHIYSDNLSRNEVQNRLNSLAQNLDTRGWATRNVSANQVQAGLPTNIVQQTSDRLVQSAPVNNTLNLDVDVHQEDDVLDVDNTQLGHDFDQRMADSAKRARQQLMDSMKNPQPQTQPQPQQQAQPAQQPTQTTQTTQNSTQNQQVPQYDPYGNIHQKVINPISDQATTQAQPSIDQPQQQQVTQQPTPDIINLSQNSDLDIATIQRQANKKPKEKSLEEDNEISLH